MQSHALIVFPFGIFSSSAPCSARQTCPNSRPPHACLPARSEQEAAAAAVVRGLSPSARLVSSLGGCQKFELPVGEAGVDAIFALMEAVKARQAGGCFALR